MSQAAVSISIPLRPRPRRLPIAPPKRIAGSFAAVFVAYWLYWLIAVPWIEPGLEEVEGPRAAATEADIASAKQQVATRRTAVARYFPDGAWERDNPQIWQSDQTRLLFKSLTPMPDGKTVLLKPCTLLFFPKGGAEAAMSDVHPIIMQAPQGARIKFDQKIALESVDFGTRKLDDAHLDGPITIHRQESRPEANDDLLVTTHDVELTPQRVWTNNPVQFRLGHNHGSGRDMQILLSPPEGPDAGGMRAGSPRLLELKREVVMFLELGAGPLAPTVPGAAPQAPSVPGKPQPPTRITCQGPFQYDMQRYAATFRDQVDVVRLNATGASDELNCELLTVLFESERKKPEPASQAAAPAADANASGLQVRQIQARGDPVTLRSPTQSIYVHCRGFDYAPGAAGATGSLLALGPGVMQGNVPNDPAGKYQVHWSREFRFEPEGAQHVAKLLGDAKVWYPAMGELTAQEIFAWLSPKVTQPGAAQAWQLERMMARGDVAIDAPQMIGHTAELNATVDRPPLAAPGESTAEAPREPKKRGPAQNSTQRFDVRGGSMHLQLLAEGEQMAVTAATVEKQASLREVSAPRPGEKPLVVLGDRLHVTGAQTEDVQVTVSGRPGQLDAGGMSLSGRDIHLEKRSNHLWIEGPGRMMMPVDQDLDGKTLAKPQMLDVTWQGGMDFLSDTVVYQKTVMAKSEHQFLRTEKLQAVLSRPVDFSNPAPINDPRSKPGDKPQVSQVRCFGPAFLQSVSFDERGAKSAFDQLDAYDLSVDKLSGDIQGRGPGVLTHVAYASDQSLNPTGDQPPQTRTAAGGPTAAPQLRYLKVAFENSISGNLNRRVVTFGDQTTSVYGPVPNWETTLDVRDPDALPPDAILLEAKTLTVYQMAPRSKAERGWFELAAQGNVLGQGANQGSHYTARGHLLTYSEQKQQLVLRGDGLSPAVFYQEDGAGNSLPAARGDALQYSLKQKHVQVTGFSNFSIDAPKADKKGGQKPAGPFGP